MTWLESEKFWEGVASLTWPFLALFIFVRIYPTLKAVIDGRKFVIKVAGMEINVAEATENFGMQITRIQEKIAEIEERIGQSGEEFGTAQHTQPRPDAVDTKPEERRLLWVDDYPVNNAFLIDKFEKDGLEVEKALSTTDALRKLENVPYSVIITDLGRKENGIDNKFAGLELIRSVRKLGNNTPILVFAGQRGLENKDKLIEVGAHGVTASGSDVINFVEKHVASK